MSRQFASAAPTVMSRRDSLGRSGTAVSERRIEGVRQTMARRSISGLDRDPGRVGFLAEQKGTGFLSRGALIDAGPI